MDTDKQRKEGDFSPVDLVPLLVKSDQVPKQRSAHILVVFIRVYLWSKLASLILLLSGCGHDSDRRPAETLALPAVRVQVVAAQTRKQPAIEEVVGTVRAKLRATLEAKLSGRIEALPVVLGQNVKKGQLVSRLAAEEIKAR